LIRYQVIHNIYEKLLIRPWPGVTYRTSFLTWFDFTEAPHSFSFCYFIFYPDRESVEPTVYKIICLQSQLMTTWMNWRMSKPQYRRLGRILKENQKLLWSLYKEYHMSVNKYLFICWKWDTMIYPKLDLLVWRLVNENCIFC